MPDLRYEPTSAGSAPLLGDRSLSTSANAPTVQPLAQDATPAAVPVRWGHDRGNYDGYSHPELPRSPAPTVQTFGPSMPSLPGASSMPRVPSVPGLPSAPSMPGLPSMPAVPSMPNLPTAPSMPAVPSMPDLPAVPDLPSVPDLPHVSALPPAAAGAAGAVGAAAGAVAGGLPSMDELVRRLFDPLAARIKAEIRLDRERAGLITDLRR
jgi:hypothetical protein